MHAHLDRIGRRRARWLIAGGLAATSIAWGSAGAAATAAPDVTVRNERGLYVVSAQFHVAQAAPAVFEVLTDYERIPRFMPGVKTSIVRERSAGHVVVEQEAVARLMLFSKRIYLLLEVCTEANELRFRDISGRSFSRYDGAWRIEAKDGYTLLTYELSAQPSFDVPDFVLARLLKRDAKDMIEHLRDEIASRAR